VVCLLPFYFTPTHYRRVDFSHDSERFIKKIIKGFSINVIILLHQ